MNVELFQEKLNQKGLKQTDLAAILGLSRASISMKFKNKRDFDLKQVSILKKQLRLSDKEIADIFLSQKS